MHLRRELKGWERNVHQLYRFANSTSVLNGFRRDYADESGDETKF